MKTINELNVTVVGMGYVGLTLSVVMAEHGLKVCGIEKNEDIYNSLCVGKSHFYETGIQKRIADLVSLNNDDKLLRFDREMNHPADIWIITVGTPLSEDNNSPNLSYVTTVSQQISKQLKAGDLVIARSTVPVGTTRGMVVPILEENSCLKAGVDFSVVFAPERTIEGAALEEIKNLPQVIGGLSQRCVEYAKKFFMLFIKECIEAESVEAAEMIKLIDNTYRDFIFAYSNQMAQISSKMNINFNNLIQIANYKYSRNKVPMPSPGVGGACLSKDPYILQSSARKYNTSADFIIHGRKINESMPVHVIETILGKAEEIGIHSENLKIFIMGFAFKGSPPTSDLRNSITIDFVRELKLRNCNELAGFDQYVDSNTIESMGINYSTVEQGISNSNVVLILNNNPHYLEEPIYSYLLEAQNKPLIFFDGWNQFNNKTHKNIDGVHYMGC